MGYGDLGIQLPPEGQAQGPGKVTRTDGTLVTTVSPNSTATSYTKRNSDQTK